jgi:hypothetical protein
MAGKPGLAQAQQRPDDATVIFAPRDKLPHAGAHGTVEQIDASDDTLLLRLPCAPASAGVWQAVWFPVEALDTSALEARQRRVCLGVHWVAVPANCCARRANPCAACCASNS